MWIIPSNSSLFPSIIWTAAANEDYKREFVSQIISDEHQSSDYLYLINKL